jgi:hypothetical protein
MKKKKLIIMLIKDHLIVTRLVEGLQHLGLQSDYSIHASEIVFKLMGISDDQEDLFEEFLEWCKEAAKLDLYKYPKYLDNASRSIYKLLKREIGYIENAKQRTKNNVR